MRTIRTAGAVAALAAAAACVATTAPAGAAVAIPEIPGIKNPLTTNVPILAWKGAEVKLVACSPQIQPFSGQKVEFRVQKFSGTDGGSGVNTVQKMAGTETIFSSTGLVGLGGQGCAKANFDSLEAGLALIHMTVTQDDVPVVKEAAASKRRRARASTGLPIVEHDFVVGFMKLNAPSLDEIAADEPTGSSGVNSRADFGNQGGPYGAADVLGDPLGDGQFDAGENNGRMTSFVTGTIPIRNGFFDENDLGSSVTLPGGWSAMANAMATDQDSSVSRAAAAQRWDIHDDRSTNAVHVPGTGCDNVAAGATVDAVDNCEVVNSIGLGAPDGAFSRLLKPGVAAPLTQEIFGIQGLPLGIANLTIGPFDSVLPDGSLLTDGKLDANDAPMPAARIDYEIVSDADSIGSLDEASKPDAYSRDGEAGYLTAEPKGNLYAPFYVQTPTVKAREGLSVLTGGLVPGLEASGVDSAFFTSNFPGLGSLPGVGGDNPLAQFVYPNWEFASVLEEAVGGNNGCHASGGSQYQLPEGPQVVSVLTDEHGESQAEFDPGTGFVKPAGAIDNANGGCDLQGVKVLGTSTIRATARYPYHDSLDNGSKQSNTIVKTVNSLFDKSLSYWSKGAGSNNSVAKIVIAHAQDIDGSALAGETVCFMADHNTEGMRIFKGNTGKDGKVFVNGPAVADPAQGLHRVCGLTDANGNVALEVFNSNGTRTNVIAEYYDEGLLRHIFVEFGQSSSGGQSPPPVPEPKPDPEPEPAGDEGKQPASGGQAGGDAKDGGTPPQEQGQPQGQQQIAAPLQPAPQGAEGTTPPTVAQLQVAGVSVSPPRAGLKATLAKHVVSGRVVRPLRGRAHLRLRVSGPAGQVAVRVRLLNGRGTTVRTAVVRVQANRLVKVSSMRIGRAVRRVKLSID